MILFILSIIVFNELIRKMNIDHGIVRVRQTASEEIKWRIAKQMAMMIIVVRHPFEGGLANKGEYETLFHSWSGFIPTQPHNAYIDMGMYAGIIGWIILIQFVRCIRNIKKRLDRILKDRKKYNIIYEGNYWAIIAVMSVSLFHNAGFFDGESSSVILIGLISIIVKKNKKYLRSNKYNIQYSIINTNEPIK